MEVYAIGNSDISVWIQLYWMWPSCFSLYYDASSLHLYACIWLHFLRPCSAMLSFQLCLPIAHASLPENSSTPLSNSIDYLTSMKTESIFNRIKETSNKNQSKEHGAAATLLLKNASIRALVLPVCVRVCVRLSFATHPFTSINSSKSFECWQTMERRMKFPWKCFSHFTTPIIQTDYYAIQRSCQDFWSISLV